MSCCGKKRKEWLYEAKSSSQPKIQNKPMVVTTKKPTRIFEYTGTSSLTMTAPSGRLYNFRHKGQRLTVDYMDSFALMSEKDLRLVQ